MKTLIRVLSILLLSVHAHLLAADIEPFFAPVTWIGNDGAGFEDYLDDTGTGNWESDVQWVDMAGATFYNHAWRKANFVDSWENTITMAWPGSHWPVSTGGSGTNVTSIGTNTFMTNIVDTDLEWWPFPSEWKWHRDTFDEYDYDPQTLDPGYGYEGHWDLNTAQLWTGGDPSVTSMNLIRVNLALTANHVGSAMTVHDFFIGAEQFDTNGNIFLKLADNQWVDGTVDTYVWPVWYEYEVTPVKGKLQIWRNGTNITDATSTVVVGEQVSLWCGFTNDVATITNFSWTVPGTYVGDFQADNSTGKVVPFVATNASATFHWLRGSSGSEFLVQCTAIVKGITLSASTKFIVRGVDASLIAQVTDTVHVTNNATLRFSGASNGMRFTYSDPTFDGYTGSYKFLFVQTGTNYAKTWFGPLGGDIATSSGLDTDYPYKEFFNTNTARTFDSPSEPLNALNVGVTRSDQYTMWLMFQPTSVTSRPVPLRSLSWNWNGTVTNTPPWTLTSSSPTTAGATITGTATTSYPEWITNITSRTLIYWP